MKRWIGAAVLGIGVAAFGVQIKSNTLFLGVTANYLNSRSFVVEGIGDRAFKGAGAQIGYYFYIPNRLNLVNRILFGYAQYRDNVQPSDSTERGYLRIYQYTIAYDLVVTTGTQFHPYFGLGYNFYHMDWKDTGSADFSGTSFRLGTLVYLGPQVEFELGGSYIHIDHTKDLETHMKYPVWEGRAGFNISF